MFQLLPLEFTAPFALTSRGICRFLHHTKKLNTALFREVTPPQFPGTSVDQLIILILYSRRRSCICRQRMLSVQPIIFCCRDQFFNKLSYLFPVVGEIPLCRFYLNLLEIVLHRRYLIFSNDHLIRCHFFSPSVHASPTTREIQS